MSNSAKFTFVCGDDEFLVSDKGKAWFEKATEGIADELSKEVIDGRGNNLDEVSQIIDRFIEAIQTQSMFGEKKVVWLKAVNFLANTQTGNAKGTLELLEHLKSVLESIDREAVSVLITASPIYKVRSFYKWCIKEGDSEVIDSSKDGIARIGEKIQQTCSKLGIKISQGAIQLLNDKVNGNNRLIAMEVEKLTTYVEKGGAITEELINEMVPNFGEGDFFEATDAFFSGQLEWMLEALSRHFFTQTEARPLLGSLQSRNRLMIQLRILKDSGELGSGFQRISQNDLARISGKFQEHFDQGTQKSNLNVFTQNPYYLGRLLKDVSHFSLKNLIDFQIAFAETFEAIVENPKDPITIFNQLAIRCLGD
jgi:DNA polymerase-3 subunit delta